MFVGSNVFVCILYNLIISLYNFSNLVQKAQKVEKSREIK